MKEPWPSDGPDATVEASRGLTAETSLYDLELSASCNFLGQLLHWEVSGSEGIEDWAVYWTPHNGETWLTYEMVMNRLGRV